MERLATAYKLRPGKRDEYVKAHREIWPEITKGLKDAGCREMTIFLRGDLLFLYVVIENVDDFNKKRANDPYYRKWAARMDEFLVVPFDEKEASAFARLDEIWRFEA